MKIKTDTRLLAALGILAIISIAPVSSSVFAQTNTSDNDSDENKKLEKEFNDLKKEELKKLREELKDLQRQQKTDFKEIRDEKMREIRDVASDIVPRPLPFDERPTISDREPDLIFKGQTTGWAILGGKAIDSSITISGSAFQTDEKGVWKIHVTHGTVSVGDKIATLEMTGFARGNHISLHGTGHIDENNAIKIGLRGNYAPTSEEGVFAVTFTHGVIQNDDSAERLKIMQVGSIHVEATSISETEVIEELEKS